MYFNRKLLFVLLVYVLSFAFLTEKNALAEEELLHFNEYGVVEGANLKETRTILNDTQWESFDSKKNVPLDKVWTVTFNDTVSFDKIDAVVIERNNEFIPVTITKTAQKTLKVAPTYGFHGNTQYQLKIILANGFKYKMDFTTSNTARSADLEPNNTYITASSLPLNETVSGTLSPADREDYYKIELPADGEITINVVNELGTSSSIYLYGSKGSDDYSIKSNSGVTANLKAGLQEGTYYIRINNNSSANYKLTAVFLENTYQNDNGASTYIQASEIYLNSKMYGHVGYSSSSDYRNNNDYFKLVIPEDGRLDINAVQLNGNYLNLYIYGARGNDQSDISYQYGKITAQMSVGLSAGTYYIRINDSGNYGAYELTNNFTPDSIPNDNASSNYILANSIPLNSSLHGHLGYHYDNLTKNTDDFYKLEILEPGTIDISALGLNGNKINLYLYDSNGTDGWSLKDSYNKTEAKLTYNVTPGKYYIRLNYSNSYGPYELTTNFYKQP
ncbi:PPC domain-containing protein [Lysinibacillus capsici]|uniref:PPC domain-containing protein n=1 Tax=Lysinibacillus capsici TaxID=2115968 RepID=UPI0032E42427